MEGWIKLHRSLFNWEWYDDIETFRLFTHCLLRANHKDNNWRGQEVKKGSFITSYSNLANETGLSIKVVRNRLKKLEKSGELGTQTSNKNTLITVSKYEFFQQEETTKGTQRARKGHAMGTQRATNKNDNNDNNEKNLTPLDAVKKDSNNEKFLKFCDWIDENLEYIPTMKTQITEKEFNKILENHDPQKVADKLDRMDIWFSGLPDNDKARKRTKVYPTLRGFLKD